MDVTLPALHQEAIAYREDVFENARKIKARAYPRKDASGRLLTESACIPFILSSMGGLCKEGHDFLRVCKKKDPVATQWMIDVLVTQHSKWTARRLRRALFGQSIVDFTADPWAGVHSERDSKAAGAQKKTKKKLSRLEREFSQGEGQASIASSSQSSEQTEQQSSEVTIVESSCEERALATTTGLQGFSALCPRSVLSDAEESRGRLLGKALSSTGVGVSRRAVAPPDFVQPGQVGSSPLAGSSQERSFRKQTRDADASGESLLGRGAGEEMPDGTMYFSNGSFFQDFSGFQKQNFQVHFQQANNVSHPQEQIFSTSFLEPASQQDLL